MDRAFERALMLVIVGVLLFVGPLVLIEPGQSTYYIDARAVDSTPDDATVVPLSEVNETYRDDVRQAIGQTGDVNVGHRHPSFPAYVSHDGQTYSLAIAVADPGGGGTIVGLASFGLGLLAFAGAAVYGLKGGWRRYRR